MSLWQWADWLPPMEPGCRVSLGEGQTPVVRSRRIGPSLGLRNLYFKLEMLNPTGSYKDRYAAVATSDMLAHGQRRCLATSSGNAGAALAAYCAAAGIDCHIAIVDTTPQGKLNQMLAYGAHLYRVRGSGVDARVSQRVREHLQDLATEPRSALQISAFKFSPVGMTGIQTIAYELAKNAPEPPEHVYCPAGGGGLTLGVARGFAQARANGWISRDVRVHCAQPEGNDTTATPLRDGHEKARPVASTTEISGLQVATVNDGDEVIKACRACGGTGEVVSDTATFDMQRRLSREEGIFCEPAGAVAAAAAAQAAREGRLEPQAPVVCLVTGSGFKDPPSIDRMIEATACPVLELDEFLAKRF